MSRPPDREGASDPVAAWAASGVVALTGSPDGPPLVPPGCGARRAAELALWISDATEHTSHPVRVDGPALLGERAALTDACRRGLVSVGGSCRLLQAEDGWVAVSCARPDDPALLGALISRRLHEDPWPAVARWLREHACAELGERAELLGLAAGPVLAPAVSSAPPVRLGSMSARSMAGLQVVDFSALWAGPLCAHLLALAGAEVTKVETPYRSDGARAGNADFYRLLHAGHSSVVVDPDSGVDRRALVELVKRADIVIEASRPRALARFGLDAEAAARAGTTWISITAYGRADDRVGFGDDVAAASGLVAWETTGGPLFCGDALADPLTGLTAAVAAMSTSEAHAGKLWDIAMSETVAATLEPAGAQPRPAEAAFWGDGRWWARTAQGPVPVAMPHSRTPLGRAPAPGEHTDQVLTRLGVR